MAITLEQVYVALAGDFECGKSTLIGVLSTGKLDNGHGLARMQVPLSTS